eukprot:COSAG02_NODE_215_length_28614_cov_43.077047_19_plen_269_part_00
MLLTLNCFGAFALLGVHFGVSEFWCGLPPNELCTDSAQDCCANTRGNEWMDPEYATCVDGFEPTTQPTSYDNCPNYKCVTAETPKTDQAGNPFVAEADSSHCLGDAIGGAAGYLIGAGVAAWGLMAIRAFNGPKIKRFGVTWATMCVISGFFSILRGETLFNVGIALGLNLWLAHAAVSLGNQVAEGTITAQNPTGLPPTASAWPQSGHPGQAMPIQTMPVQRVPLEAMAVPVQAVAVPVQAVAVAVQPEQQPVAVPVAGVTKVNQSP